MSHLRQLFGERGFEALLESAPDGILVVDSAGRILLANRSAESVFGYERGKLEGLAVDELVPGRFRGGHARHRESYAADPHTRPMGIGLDLFGRRRDGAEFPVEISLSALPTETETLVVTVVRDVTERRALEAERLELVRAQAAEAEAATEARRLRGVQAVSDAALGTVSLPDLLRAMLEPVRRALGADAAGIQVREQAGEITAGPETTRHSLRAPLRLHGERIGELTAGRSEDPPFTPEDELMLERLAERIALAIGQSRAYEATRAAEARLREILGDVAGIVWEADEPDRRRFSFVSDGAESLLGHPIANWLNEDEFWVGILDPVDREMTLARAADAIRRGIDHELEYRIRAADGRTVWMRDRVRIIRAPSGGLRMHGLMTDVTERRDLESQLLQAQKMQAVGQLAGGVAHDFNNMLTAIIGYGSLLSARIEDEHDRADLQQIEKAAKRAQALTEQLLSFSRRRDPHHELVDVNELVAGVQPMLRRLIDEDIELSLALAPQTVLVEADPAQLEQVLMNLVINARDAMTGGGQLRVDVEAREGQALLHVSDDGVGMPPEVRARVFEPFFTTKAPGKGTGLGLATVYGIVDEAGGRIQLESEPGAGTRVTVSLPQAAAGAPEADPEVEEPMVLVVEDETALRELVRRVLETDGRRVLEARNGREALELLERHAVHVELMITDVVMPEMGGPELVQHVTARWPHLRVIYSSGYTDSRLAGRGFDEDAVDLLRKPYTVGQLRERVAKALDG